MTNTTKIDPFKFSHGESTMENSILTNLHESYLVTIIMIIFVHCLKFSIAVFSARNANAKPDYPNLL